MKKTLLLLIPLAALAPPHVLAAQPSACAFGFDVSIGSTGPPVVCLQESLIEAGYSIPAGATGYFGFQTRAAVAAWQENTGVYPPYGYFGPISRARWAALYPSPTTASREEPQEDEERVPSRSASRSGGGGSSRSNDSDDDDSSSGSSSGSSGSVLGTSTPSQPVNPPPTPNDQVLFSCDFTNSPTDCGFAEQYKGKPATPGRATIATVGRTDSTAVRLHTEPGDSNVNGSGSWERNDLTLGAQNEYCNAGQEEWWAHSVLFPDEYVFPPGPPAGVLLDFHHQGSRGQANLELQTIPGTGLRLEGYGGEEINGGRHNYIIADPYGAPKGEITKNKWYDFVYHIKWAPNSDGFMEAWLNGKKIATFNGPTLYKGMGCYLKLANYHAAFGKPSSVIHDRIIRGTSANAVSLTPLERLE